MGSYPIHAGSNPAPAKEGANMNIFKRIFEWFIKLFGLKKEDPETETSLAALPENLIEPLWRLTDTIARTRFSLTPR